jgi:hypothetical protein
MSVTRGRSFEDFSFKNVELFVCELGPHGNLPRDLTTLPSNNLAENKSSDFLLAPRWLIADPSLRVVCIGQSNHFLRPAAGGQDEISLLTPETLVFGKKSLSDSGSGLRVQVR